MIISQEACDIVNTAKANKKNLLCRNYFYACYGKFSIITKTLNPYTGWTNKFIYPPYDFSIADCMITNFHTPKSTLLMMISRFLWS